MGEVFGFNMEEINMNGNKKFKEIYEKFGGSYGDLIEEHLSVIKELENCRKMLFQQKSKKEKR